MRSRRAVSRASTAPSASPNTPATIAAAAPTSSDPRIVTRTSSPCGKRIVRSHSHDAATASATPDASVSTAPQRARSMPPSAPSSTAPSANTASQPPNGAPRVFVTCRPISVAAPPYVRPMSASPRPAPVISRRRCGARNANAPAYAISCGDLDAIEPERHAVRDVVRDDVDDRADEKHARPRQPEHERDHEAEAERGLEQHGACPRR